MSGKQPTADNVDYVTEGGRMCDLCSADNEVRKRAGEEAEHMAERLQALARSYLRLANGTIKPHTEEAKRIGNVARLIIRNLVEEWL